MVVSTRNTNRDLCPQEISGPQKGIGLMNCHPCKKRHQVDWQCKLCQLAFCVDKLQNMYHLQKDLETEDWTCPRCLLHICRCLQCKIFYSKNNISLPEDEAEDGDKAEKKKLDDVELVRLRKENEECKRKLEMTERYVDMLQGSIKDLRGQLQQVREDHEHQLQKLKDALEARIALEKDREHQIMVLEAKVKQAESLAAAAESRAVERAESMQRFTLKCLDAANEADAKIGSVQVALGDAWNGDLNSWRI